MDRFLLLSGFFLFIAIIAALLTPAPTQAGLYCYSSGGEDCVVDTSVCEATFGQADCGPGLTCCKLKSGPPTTSIICGEDKTYVAILNSCVSLGDFINVSIAWGIMIAGALALIRLVVGGIQFIFATGDPKSMESARSTISGAIFGLFLVLLAYLILFNINRLVPSEWQINFFGL